MKEKHYKRGGNINTDKMINMLLINIAKKKDVFYMEKRTYKHNKIYKGFFIRIGNEQENFKNKKELLTYLSKRR